MPLFSRKLSEKILPSLGLGFAENFWERTFGFWFLCSAHVFWSCFANIFASLHGVVPRKLSENILPFLGPRFKKIFGSELLFFWCLCFVEVFGAVSPRFLLYCVPFLLPQAVWKIILSLGANFWFLVLVLGPYFLELLCQCVCFLAWRCSPKAVWKNSPILRSAFQENFREWTLVFLVFVFCRSFLVLFCQGFCSIVCLFFSRKLSEKIILSLGLGFAENFWERTFVFWFWCSVHVFWSCFANVFASLHGVVPPKAVWKNYPILRSALRENFRERTLVFLVFVFCRSFLVLFRLGFCSIGCLCSPESCLKILLVGCARGFWVFFGVLGGRQSVPFVFSFVLCWRAQATVGHAFAMILMMMPMRKSSRNFLGARCVLEWGEMIPGFWWQCDRFPRNSQHFQWMWQDCMLDAPKFSEIFKGFLRISKRLERWPFLFCLILLYLGSWPDGREGGLGRGVLTPEATIAVAVGAAHNPPPPPAPLPPFLLQALPVFLCFGVCVCTADSATGP